MERHRKCQNITKGQRVILSHAHTDVYTKTPPRANIYRFTLVFPLPGEILSISINLYDYFSFILFFSKYPIRPIMFTIFKKNMPSSVDRSIGRPIAYTSYGPRVIMIKKCWLLDLRDFITVKNITRSWCNARGLEVSSQWFASIYIGDGRLPNNYSIRSMICNTNRARFTVSKPIRLLTSALIT